MYIGLNLSNDSENSKKDLVQKKMTENKSTFNNSLSSDLQLCKNWLGVYSFICLFEFLSHSSFYKG